MLPAPAPSFFFLATDPVCGFLGTYTRALHPRLRFCIPLRPPSASEAFLPHFAGVQGLRALGCCLKTHVVSSALAGVWYVCVVCVSLGTSADLLDLRVSFFARRLALSSFESEVLCGGVFWVR